MAKLSIEVEVSKETYELGMAVGSMISGIKGALEDGWDLGEDLPAIVQAVVRNLGETMEGIREAGDEWEEDPQAFIAAVSLSIAEVMEIVKG